MRRLRLAVVAAAVLLAMPASAGAQQRTISVTGDATLTARNDTARVGFGATAQRRTRSAALNASSARVRRVIAALRSSGVAARDIRTGAVTVARVRQGRRSRRTRRFRARQSITATVRSARRAGAVVGAAIDAGATSVNGPRFFISDQRALFRRALTIAFEEARAKAAALAQQAGLKLGSALAIRESSFQDAGGVEDNTDQEGAVGAPKRQGAAPVPTRPGSSTVEAGVDVVFEAR